ncbi:MAG: SpoIIE family protein phosphatase [Bryobacteraceae bacterium]
MRSILPLLGRPEKLFLSVLLFYLVLVVAGPPGLFRVAVMLAAYGLGIAVAIRWIRRGIVKVIWRLRNRLVVAYVFIALVPVALILTLVGIGGYAVTGQVAIYLVHSELQRRAEDLRMPARLIARTPPEMRERVVRELSSHIRERLPEIELAVRGRGEFHFPSDSNLSGPPAGWQDTDGLIIRDGRIYAWAHVASEASEVTMLAPLSRSYLAGLIPNLGDVSILMVPDLSSQRRGAIPPPVNRFDSELTWLTPIPVALWDSPGASDEHVLVVRSRPSAVLRTVFGQGVNWAQGVFLTMVLAAVMFFAVELVSLVIGVSITRTITQAVHNLYEGTEKIKEGDFSHRIAVSGNDQLAELSASFNGMTENLERLIVVEKEKERLQSEVEIAREVQQQLFPRTVPALKTLQLSGVCRPARMVSGDYYDFLLLHESAVALALGDVAGKGISAALLMAAIQSNLRTQLTAGIATAAAAGGSGGGMPNAFQAADLIGRLNRQLYDTTPPEKYATFFFGLYDDRDTTLTYINAGHLPPILIRGGEPRLLEVTGTVIGAFPFVRYEEERIRLDSGDLLVAYTDGITEPENEYGEMFGEERLTDLLVKHWRESGEAITARIMEAVLQWTGSPELQDDMTVLLARRI